MKKKHSAHQIKKTLHKTAKLCFLLCQRLIKIEIAARMNYKLFTTFYILYLGVIEKKLDRFFISFLGPTAVHGFRFFLTISVNLFFFNQK